MDIKFTIDNPDTVHNAKLFHTKLLADVVFVLRHNNEEVKVWAHKSILASECNHFKKEFCEQNMNEFEMDVNPEAFNEFLQFFYLNKFHMTIKHIVDVLRLILAFNVDEFYPKCEKLFQAAANNNDIIYPLYEIAVRKKLAVPLTKLLEISICTNPKAAFKRSPIGGSDPKILKHLLHTSKFKCDEYDVFMGVIMWATKSLQQKQQPISIANIKLEIGECLYEIRFPTMTWSQFMTCAERFHGLFDAKVDWDILHFISSQQKMKIAKRFSTVSRSGVATTIGEENRCQVSFGGVKFVKGEPIYEVRAADHYDVSGELTKYVLTCEETEWHADKDWQKHLSTNLTIKCGNDKIFARYDCFVKWEADEKKIRIPNRTYVYSFKEPLPIVENKVYTFSFGTGRNENNVQHVFYFRA